MGIEDIYIVDNVNTSEKWMNLRNKKYIRYFHKDEFLNELDDLDDISCIIHMGACSSTTEQDFDYLYKNNLEKQEIRFDVIEIYIEKNRYKLIHLKNVDINC